MLDANIVENGYPRRLARGFVLDASSSFYALLCDAVDKYVEKWIRSKY